MGRIIRRFRAFTDSAKVDADGQIDSGADRTVLQRSVAEDLGFSTHGKKPTDTMIVANDEKICGYTLSVCLRIGERSACVDAFVPEAQLDGPSLIGADFLQASGATLDYGKPDDQAFSGRHGPLREFHVGGGMLRFEKMTPEERAALKPSDPCRTRRPKARKRSRR
jgi:hypothetical protein